MPHSWAIAIYRFDDYKNAGIPILPVARSIYRTKIECVIYILLFAAVLNGLYCFGYTNVFFLITFNALTAYWFYLSIIGFKAENDQLWAKRFFLYSVILITLLSLSFSFTYQSPAPNLPLFLIKGGFPPLSNNFYISHQKICFSLIFTYNSAFAFFAT